MARGDSPAVRDIMTSPAISVKEGQSLGDILKVLEERHVHSIPVTDEQGRLTGTVSLYRLLNVFCPEGPHARDLLRSSIDFEPHRLEQECRPSDAERLNGIRVADLVSREVTSVDVEATLDEVRDLMTLHRETTLPVVWHGGRLVGVVTLFQVVAALLRDRGMKL